MANRIPKPFVDELLAHTDLVTLIQDHNVVLRKVGKDFTGLCPFHMEKTPSFNVRADKQFYHCFGCGAGGNAISFLMDHARLDFPTAIQELADRAGLTVPQDRANSGPDLSPYYALLAEAAGFFAEQLRSHPAAAAAREYLKMRGISPEIAHAFHVGFAPPGWDTLLTTLGRGQESIARLETVGLVIPRKEESGEASPRREKGGHYDRFRNRIMFPIRDQRGRVLAFGGRQLEGDTQGPKYLNSPESLVFHKGAELYGLCEAYRAPGSMDRLLVVEGYLDVIALAQHGVHHAVATLGTALTEGHVKALFRRISQLVYCFDGDTAGRRAARRAMELSLPALNEGKSVGFLLLPPGDDPDTFVRREGPALFTDPGAVTALSRFLQEELANGLNLDTAEGRARLVELARPLLARIPSAPFRQALAGEIGALARIELAPIEPAPPPPTGAERPPFGGPPPARATLPPRRGGVSPVAAAIHLLLHRPHLATAHATPLAALAGNDLPGTDVLLHLAALIQQDPGRSPGSLLEHWRDTPKEGQLTALLGRELLLPEEGLEDEFLSLLALIERRRERRLRETLRPTGPAGMDDGQKEEMRAAFLRLKHSKGKPGASDPTGK
jgi:DNA primase